MAIDQTGRVIGTFRDRTMAQQAIDDLHNSGWEDSQIQVLGGHNSGGMLSSLRHAFGGREEVENGSLDQLDLSDEQRQLYQRDLDAGYTVVSVVPGGRQLDAQEVFHRNGAYNVLLPAEMGGRSRVIPIRREEAQVRKEVVQTGEIRIHKRVITENKTFTIPVTREEVFIERIPPEGRDAARAAEGEREAADSYDVHHPIGMAGNVTDADLREARREEAHRPIGAADDVTDADLQEARREEVHRPIVGRANDVADAADLREARRQDELPTEAATGYEDEMLREGGTIRIFVREERVRIDKYPVVVEEIVVHKEVVQEQQRLVEPIRHEEISVEHTGNVPLHGAGFEDAAAAPLRDNTLDRTVNDAPIRDVDNTAPNAPYRRADLDNPARTAPVRDIRDTDDTAPRARVRNDEPGNTAL